jgi:hypothetical protein
MASSTAGGVLPDFSSDSAASAMNTYDTKKRGGCAPSSLKAAASLSATGAHNSAGLNARQGHTNGLSGIKSNPSR